MTAKKEYTGQQRRHRNPGQGSRQRHKNMPRIVIGFDEETFEQVRRLAEKSGVSFAEQNRLLVEWGLEAAEQEDQQ